MLNGGTLLLSQDDPARARIEEFRAKGATIADVIDASETYEVPSRCLVKALSPGHAREIVRALFGHMAVEHCSPGSFALSDIGEANELPWLSGPLTPPDLDATLGDAGA